MIKPPANRDDGDDYDESAEETKESAENAKSVKQENSSKPADSMSADGEGNNKTIRGFYLK